MRCTLSRTIVCSLAAGALAASGAACGSDDAPAPRTESFRQTPLKQPAESGTLHQRACSLLHPGGMHATANDSTDLSQCVWRRRGREIQLIVDAAPRAQLRYYNQLSEQLEFHNSEPARRPIQLRHVGDDSAYGGAGAWWTRSKGQLVAYAHARIVRVRVVGDVDARRAAVRLARVVFRRLR
jgi:hypothetical protein